MLLQFAIHADHQGEAMLKTITKMTMMRMIRRAMIVITRPV